MLLNERESKALCDKLLAYVKADDAEVSVNSGLFSHLRFADNSFRTSGRREDTDVSVTVWINKKKGSATGNGLDDASLRGVVEQAEQLARVSPADREYLPSLGPQNYRPTQGFVEATANVALPPRAMALGDVIAACEKENVVGAGFHHTSGSAAAGASRHGNFYYYKSSLASLSVTARTREGNGSGYFLRNHFDVSKLDTARIGREALEKALQSRQPRPLDPGSYTVTLEPQAVADLLRFFSTRFDARMADEGRSPFSAAGGKTKVGQRIFDERLSVYSDPWNPELPGPPVASGGIPARKFFPVKNGVLENLVYSRYWAQQKHTEPSPGPVNLIIEGGEQAATQQAMIESTAKGLVVSRFWYIRPTDPRTAALTGLTRDGVWYVADGKVQFPVHNFRFNQSLLELLAPGNVELIGAPERVSWSESQGESAALFPALKVKAFHFTSQSEAV
jgi:predicted Zn-dependent protease